MSRRAFVALAACLVAASAGAQTPVPLDPARYPMLSSLSVWLRSDASAAKNCSATTAMTLSARRSYEKLKSENAATDEIARALVTATKGKLDAAQARTLAAGYVRMAQLFLVLSPEAHGVAVAQLCRSAIERGDRPFADTALLQSLVAEAQRCNASGFSANAATFVPLECVVRTVARRR